MFVSPALHVQHYAIEPEQDRAYGLLRIQGFTPESPGVTHVFLRMARNFATDDGKVGEFLRTFFHDWAMRDTGVLQTIQQRLDEDIYPRRDINVKADRAAIRARRIAMEMVDEESGRFLLHGLLS
jgi:vanillate O-demethylase monooxygenase subunit